VKECEEIGIVSGYGEGGGKAVPAHPHPRSRGPLHAEKPGLKRLLARFGYRGGDGRERGSTGEEIAVGAGRYAQVRIDSVPTRSACGTRVSDRFDLPGSGSVCSWSLGPESKSNASGVRRVLREWFGLSL